MSVVYLWTPAGHLMGTTVHTPQGGHVPWSSHCSLSARQTLLRCGRMNLQQRQPLFRANINYCTNGNIYEHI